MSTARASSSTRGTYDLTQGIGDLPAVERHWLGFGFDLRGIVAERQRSDRELRSPGADAHLVVEGELHRTTRQRLHDVSHEPRRHDDRAVRFATHRHRQPDGQLEIGSRHRQDIADDIETHPGQHRQRARTTGGRPPGSGQRVGQDLTLATELHSAALLLMQCSDKTVVVVGAVDWGQAAVVPA